jgi:hypothetical protein
MLVSTNILFKNYLWKYVDININELEYEYLKMNINHNEECVDFFKNYEKYLNSKEDIHNLISMMSQMNLKLLEKFFKYYTIYLKKIMNINHIKNNLTFNDLKNIINTEDKFKLFIVCLYYYF